MPNPKKKKLSHRNQETFFPLELILNVGSNSEHNFQIGRTSLSESEYILKYNTFCLFIKYLV